MPSIYQHRLPMHENCEIFPKTFAAMLIFLNFNADTRRVLEETFEALISLKCFSLDGEAIRNIYTIQCLVSANYFYFKFHSQYIFHTFRGIAMFLNVDM